MRRLIALVAMLAMTVPGTAAGVWAGGAPPLPPLKRQPTARAVVKEHLAALNKCNLNRLMAQYPPSVHFFLPGGQVVKGRRAIQELFIGFCKPREEGGFKGITFTSEQVQKVGDTINVQWRAEADFLAEPYLGADAYVTKNGLMYAQVTTFGAPEPKFK